MERVMSEIVCYAAGHGYEVHLVLYNNRQQEPFYSIPSNVKVYENPYKYIDSQRFLYTIRTVAFIRRTVRHIRPDAVLSFGEIWNNLVILSLFGLKFPLYISDRCQPNKSFGRINDWLRHILYPYATGMIAQTAKAKEIYGREFKKLNIRVISNPVKKVDIPECNHRENIIISVGRLISTKNYDQLIRIALKVLRDDWKLVIVGGDALKQHNSEVLQRQIKDQNLTGRILLAGTQKNVTSYLLRSKIFAFTSSSEGFPNVIGEAMSAGLPVVAYDCVAGPSDLIEDGFNGYLISLFDEAAFADKLSTLMSNDNLRGKMSANAVLSIDRFSMEKICGSYMKYITGNEKVTSD